MIRWISLVRRQRTAQADMQSCLLPTRALVTVLLCGALSVPALARDFGINPDSLRTTLGGCPVDALRAGWAEMDALEAVAVEAEVLALCTERAEAINRFITRQIQLEAAISGLRAPASVANDASDEGLSPALVALRAEIASLRDRIDSLEGRPDEAATLPALRERLALKEAELADMEAPATDQRLSERVPAKTPVTEPVQDPVRVIETDGPSISDISPWQLLWVVRKGQDPWQAGFVRTRRTSDPKTPGQWITTTEGPFVVGKAECLPDGTRLLELSPDGPSLMADPTCSVTRLDMSQPGDIAFIAETRP